MTGYYDLTLVFTSYLVAILASYTALYFGAQLTSLDKAKHNLWLVVGSLAMGTGIWTMHFVGMRAYVMPVEMRYDLWLTLLSWVPAVLASGLALNNIGRGSAGWGQLVFSAIAMGVGISSMHYIGMEAMRMSPRFLYDPAIFVLSVVIAIAASGAALAICRTLRHQEGRQARVLQFVAALIMGVAICGMHYTGMAAVIYPEGSMPADGNALAGSWLGLPLAAFVAAFLLLALLTVIVDLRTRQAQEREQANEAERVHQMAFYDAQTGLPNRASLERHLLDTLAHKSEHSRFAVVYLELANHRDLVRVLGNAGWSELIIGLARRLESWAAGCYLTRYSTSAFALVVDDPDNAGHRTLFRRLRGLAEHPRVKNTALQWKVGVSRYPEAGQSSRMLIRSAMQTGPLTELDVGGAAGQPA